MELANSESVPAVPDSLLLRACAAYAGMPLQQMKDPARSALVEDMERVLAAVSAETQQELERTRGERDSARRLHEAAVGDLAQISDALGVPDSEALVYNGPQGLIGRIRALQFLAASELHPRSRDLVVRFAGAMAEKLLAAQRKYGYTDGWADDDWMDSCRQQLLQHVAKGDPVDVANYCAFLWHHGESTSAVKDSLTAASGIDAAPASPTYFSYGDDNGGFETHATAAEARAAAGESLDYFRDDAPEGWNDGVRNVCWGVILGEIVETESRPSTPADQCYPDCAEYVEYELRDCAANPPADARDASPTVAPTPPELLEAADNLVYWLDEAQKNHWFVSGYAGAYARLAREKIALYRAAKTGSADPDGGVEAFLSEVRAELIRARAKFPGDRIMTIALAEEFGELCKAVLDESAACVRKEAVQTAVMAARIVLDGDSSVRDWRAAKKLDPIGRAMGAEGGS